MDNKSLAHTTWNCKYHIVFAPKYRRQIVYGKIKADAGKILRQLCERKGVEIIEANLFFHLINHLYERSSIILTSNKSPDQWGDLLGDEGISTAILDRLLHRVEVIHMNDDSYRMKHRESMFENESVQN